MGLCGHKQYEEAASYRGTNIHTSNTSIHITLDVITWKEDIKRAETKLYHRIRQHDKPNIAALRNYDIHMHYSTPEQSRYYVNRSQMQASYEWRTSDAVAPYNKSNTRMDTPHLRSLGPPSDRCFYPHVVIQPSRLLGLPAAFTLVSRSSDLTLKMEVICSFEMSVVLQRTTRRYIPQDNIFITTAVRTSNPTSKVKVKLSLCLKKPRY
jgi:hypothetical protein